MSGLWKSTLIKGNKITDFAQTSATVGRVIPFGRGRFPVDGNIIFAQLPPKENRTVKRQGKGGVKTESFTYMTSYAIAFAVGPVYGFWWIKRNGKVVWTNDPEAPIEDQAYAAKWAQKATFYFGTSSQLPDSTIEAVKGSGQVSAFRYLAFIVVEGDDVTDGGGAIPGYEAVMIASPPEIYLTSKPYAQIFYDEGEASLVPIGGELRQLLFESDMEDDETIAMLAPTGGVLYQPPPGEIFDETEAGLLPVGGELKIPPPQEFFDETEAGLVPTGGMLQAPPLGNIQEEEVEATLAPTGGTLVDIETGLLALFASRGDASGGMWDFKRLATMFQLSGGSTPVTTTGDPIGYTGDLSGLANHFIQATAGNRPLYDPAYGAVPDGTTDYLQATATVGLHGIVGVAMRSPASQTGSKVLIQPAALAATHGSMSVETSTTVVRYVAGSVAGNTFNAPQSGGLANSTNHYTAALFNNSSAGVAQGRLNQAFTSGARNAGVGGSGAIMTLFCSTSIANYADYPISRAVAIRSATPFTTSDLLLVEQWLRLGH